ncbi:MAG: purine-nucleoside phosphorylase [Myxococcales bacterium]|nr:purine-nucleoside phosphorylase [Myxococcales bacterium]
MNRHPESDAVERAHALLAQHLGEAPPTAIVLGSGLGPVVARIREPRTVPSTEVGFPQSTVAGHAGKLVLGELEGAPVVALSGRVHLYEGLPPAVVVRCVRALHAWGVKQIVLTASVGGITEGLDPGEVVLVTDHINLQGRNPLTGPAWGTRFPDLSNAYHPRLRGVLAASAAATRLTLHEGVYAAMPGPSYETPAEVRMLRTLGADVVGMSTVPEVLAANELGLPVAAIAVVSNRAAGLGDGALHHEEVTVAANLVADRLADLFSHAIPRF